MDSHIKKVYVPMTETGFYILLCLREESHGYNIVRKVELLTQGEVRISPGTMYGSLSKMEKDGLIRQVLGERMFEAYTRAKKEEWAQYSQQVSEWETQQYLYRI